jgi:RNA polymerase sigma factor (sigma-70 family)
VTAEQKLSQTKLARKITGAAHNVARQWNADPDDIEQEMVLAILERYAADASFFDQTDAYIVNAGAWAVRDALRRQARQWNNEVEDADTAGGTPILDLAATEDPWAGVVLGMALESAVAGLDEVDQQIVAGMFEGFSSREIGEMTGISYRTVYNHLPQIAEAVRAQL